MTTPAIHTVTTLLPLSEAKLPQEKLPPSSTVTNMPELSDAVMENVSDSKDSVMVKSEHRTFRRILFETLVPPGSMLRKPGVWGQYLVLWFFVDFYTPWTMPTLTARGALVLSYFAGLWSIVIYYLIPFLLGSTLVPSLGQRCCVLPPTPGFNKRSRERFVIASTAMISPYIGWIVLGLLSCYRGENVIPFHLRCVAMAAVQLDILLCLFALVAARRLYLAIYAWMRSGDYLVCDGLEAALPSDREGEKSRSGLTEKEGQMAAETPTSRSTVEEIDAWIKAFGARKRAPSRQMIAKRQGEIVEKVLRIEEDIAKKQGEFAEKLERIAKKLERIAKKQEKIAKKQEEIAKNKGEIAEVKEENNRPYDGYLARVQPSMHGASRESDALP